MKRALASVLVAGLGLAAFSTVSFAGANANAKLLLHLNTTTTKLTCGVRGTPSCVNVVSNGALYPTNYFAYLVVADGNQVAGLGGLQCGIQYNGALGAGVDVFSWTLCATLEFSSTGWPNAGGGNLITWDTATKCQRFVPAGNDPANGVTAAAGYFYMGAYTADVMQITPRPVDGQAKVADCLSNEDLIGGTGFPAGPPSHLGSASFSGAGNIAGYNPCGLPTPVANTTWSGIKGAYSK